MRSIRFDRNDVLEFKAVRSAPQKCGNGIKHGYTLLNWSALSLMILSVLAV